MAQVGVLALVLPGSDPTLVAPLVHLEQLVGVDPHPMARLAALGGDDVTTRLRLSRADQKRLMTIRDHCTSLLGAKAIGHIAGAKAGLGAILLRAAMANTPPTQASVDAVAEGARTEFPIKASDLPDFTGKALGERLAALKQDWLASDLAKSKNALLGA